MRRRTSPIWLMEPDEFRTLLARSQIARSQIARPKTERPNQETIRQEVEKLGYTGTGRIYCVSDNAVRKWLFSEEK